MHPKLHEKSWYYLLVIYKICKSSTQIQDRQNLDSSQAICNLHLSYNFVLELHENALTFSQSDTQFFHVYYYSLQ